jgi:hypothetical protein
VKHTETTLNIIYGYKCNYLCSGCCNGSDQVQTTDFDPSLDEILDAIPIAAQYFDIDPNGMITLLGGELFMYWDKIVPIAIQARKSFPNAKINMFSNGHLLYKHMDQVVNLMKELGNSCVTITKHLTGMFDKPLGERWLNNIEKVKQHPDLVVLHDEHFHINNRIDCNFYLYDGEQWFTWYKLLDDDTIKPHASGNPARSMEYGCASGSRCSTMFGSRYYKCGTLAMLPGLLAQKGQLDDADWDKYLNQYPYIDLNNFSQENFDYYVSTYGKPIPQCDMCNDNPDNIVLWKDRDYDMIFKNIKVVSE